VIWTDTPPAGAVWACVAVESCDFEPGVDSVFRWRRPVASEACAVSLEIVFLASSS
jgi:hypothetical protein